ncbi:cytochrome c-type biogenesis protein CcmH [Deinococcus sp. A31D244]|uniref:Cytochrome c-type biogenesis protein n=1 Tax=Deinococcus aquaticus TaxID=328692 RepID=A0ABY7V478_9DEIO|nr:cytochrome c-type biogenesis protein CcmH [Deinococcus aquaticus]WDA58672.1 cytochrome c-type biogenesis protein CcmH [Deinococcus aquaticus]
MSRPVLAALLGLLTLLAGWSWSAAQTGAPSLTPAQEQRALAIQKNLRCPLCDTGESISDSRSDISVKMRESVREQVAAGRTDGDIYVFFSQRYGNFVLLDPPKTGRGLLLWGAPLLALALGGVFLWSFLRRTPGRAGSAAPDEAFDPFLEQVRRETRAPGDPTGGGKA